jgi:hypothetical protein
LLPASSCPHSSISGCRSPTFWPGRLIEKVTGQTYETAIKRLILGPGSREHGWIARGAAAAEPVPGQDVQVGAQPRAWVVAPL